jgi:hypothetical protein
VARSADHDQRCRVLHRLEGSAVGIGYGKRRAADHEERRGRGEPRFRGLDQCAAQRPGRHRYQLCANEGGAHGNRAAARARVHPAGFRPAAPGGVHRCTRGRPSARLAGAAGHLQPQLLGSDAGRLGSRRELRLLGDRRRDHPSRQPGRRGRRDAGRLRDPFRVGRRDSRRLDVRGLCPELAEQVRGHGRAADSAIRAGGGR